ncbi:type II toxin-antitoxin system PemI/MazE family antitoxin [Marinilactibacillus psychrotolerans]|uniref:AbrB family transcriptional regulator n=2 Tax=Marinilactibacillus psychrotolerans TaxID=191770 RepID=A0A5R9C161_9LACT|nr:AbrB family transcriptional regulator [Marinilactibacillus psychrotolerans]TLQ06417.1 AbrB family transcriptional regulator [Marinilactibacillus psychrotolerans]GEQ33361.1 hypothetical protein B795N_12430 [Marinilactibacillus psychrotolerans]SJN26393.1 hypothetical protein FM115_03700 [Marinilactibacillus psychrotolerans 42ea]
MKARKQGNSLTLTIPKKFNISEGQEFVAFKGRRGGIVYVPKKENIFDKAITEGRTIDFEDSFPNNEPLGNEMI